MYTTIKEYIKLIIKDYNDNLSNINDYTLFLEYDTKKELFNSIFKDFYLSNYKDDDIWSLECNFRDIQEENNYFEEVYISYERLNCFRELKQDIELLNDFFKNYSRDKEFNTYILKCIANYNFIDIKKTNKWINH